MSDGTPDGGERTVPVGPPVHVEWFPTHATVTWKAGQLAQFLRAVGDLDTVTPETATVVDDSSTAGRERRRVAELAASETVCYLRVEPDRPWRLSWERRTWPVVSVSGSPSVSLCRRVHLETTDCEGWSDEASNSLARLLTDR